MIKHEHNYQGNVIHNHDVKELSGKKIFWVTVLNATITITEIIGGLISGSLALLSDAMHNLSDTIAIALSYFANRIAKKPKDRKRTFGYNRAEIISAFINASVLIALSFLLIVEAFKRFNSSESINGNLMIVVAFIGLVSNLVSVFLLEKDSHESLNIKSSYLHLLGDTISSVGVLLGGIAIKFYNVIWVDPVVTIAISLYILLEAWHVIKKTVDILMQSAPDLDYEQIKKDVESIEFVNNIHHVHAWLIDEKTIHFEAHLDISDRLLSEAQGITKKIKHLLVDHYGISHVTLQAEADEVCSKDLFKA